MFENCLKVLCVRKIPSHPHTLEIRSRNPNEIILLFLLCVIPLLFYKKTPQHTYLHPKEGDAGEKVHSGFEVLESLWAAGWKVILLEWRREVVMKEE